MTTDSPAVKILPSGWTHIRFSRECFAQIPPGFNEDTIPDEYIFHSGWTRESVNNWWRLSRDR